jgi:hypothetical protein
MIWIFEKIYVYKVLEHNTCMCTARPGLNYKREERTQN